MPLIYLETKIESNIEVCFDLARSIDLHQISTAKSNERAIGGTMSGLIKLGETVTWEATHFGIKQNLTSKITQFKRPFHFRDEEVKGAFKYIIHDHNFEEINTTVIMKDNFEFQSPLGIIGKLLDKMILIDYMTQLLEERNKVIKEYAETEKWKLVLNK